MNRVFGIIVLLIMVLAFVSSLASLSSAQAARFQYTVKFVCGVSDGRVAAPGTYFTAINVHNPRYETVRFRYKVTVAKPGFASGPITPFRDTGLRADAAFEIDCVDLWRLTETKPRVWLKGFLVIETDLELDVVSVYTAAGRDGFVSTIDIERVEPSVRQPRGLADLVPVLADDFCPRNERIAFSVRNQGYASAAASQTRVEFPPGGTWVGSTAMIPTSTLAPGASVSLSVPIPTGCFNPDCDFKITVDSGALVPESDEANNSVGGACRG